jgi:hypothetical protein
MYDNVYCGISIEEGWYDIIDIASHAIYHNVKWKIDQRERLLKSNPHNLKIPDDITFPKVAQIKEKFGSLRFYVDNCDTYAIGIISMAESISNKICETCGNKGSIRHGGWIRTLCDKHEEEYQLVKLGNQNENRY